LNMHSGIANTCVCLAKVAPLMEWVRQTTALAHATCRMWKVACNDVATGVGGMMSGRNRIPNGRKRYLGACAPTQ
jgi:hypothetical protein